MKKPKIEDFKLKSIKILNGGGAEIEWRYMLSVGNDGHHHDIRLKSSVNIQDELWMLLKKQKPNVLKVEEIDYRLMSTTAEKAGADNTEILSQIAEGMTIEAMSKIEISGLKISGSDDKTNVVITYKKITGNKKIAGRATTMIQLSGTSYGFEEELVADVDEITKEAYGYIYEGKHSDSAQGELWPPEDGENDPDQEPEE